jgi:hypothetical protein
VEELWNDLSPGERAKYNKAARSEAQRYEQELREYKTIEKKAQTLREDLEDLGACHPAPFLLIFCSYVCCYVMLCHVMSCYVLEHVMLGAHVFRVLCL